MKTCSEGCIIIDGDYMDTDHNYSEIFTNIYVLFNFFHKFLNEDLCHNAF